MNLFNCFQAIAFYTIVPFGIQWLMNNGFNGWAIVLGVGEIIGFVALSVAVHSSAR